MANSSQKTKLGEGKGNYETGKLSSGRIQINNMTNIADISNSPQKDPENPLQIEKKVIFERPLCKERELEAYTNQKIRLNDLFEQINQEFELLWEENIELRRKLEESNVSDIPPSYISEKPNFSLQPSSKSSTILTGKGQNHSPTNSHNSPVQTHKRNFVSNVVGIGRKFESEKKTESEKNSSKQSIPTWEHIGSFSSHKDGIWEISSCRWDNQLFATASLDRTARVWSTTDPIVLWIGHTGSVNSVRFHPNSRLICSASGDRSCTVWKIPKRDINNPSSEVQQQTQQTQQQQQQSDDQKDIAKSLFQVQHNNAVMGADFLSSGDKFFSASWDDKVKLWSLETGKNISDLKIGSDISCWATHVSSHPKENLTVVCGTDGYFKVSDWRTSSSFIHNIQAHTESVSSVIFNPQDDNMLISSSDDKFVKIWDRRNLKNPKSSIKRSVGINKISISSVSGYLALPLDDLRVRIYDLNGKPVGQMPQNFKLHKLTPTCTTWSNDQSVVFSVGFDAQIHAIALKTRKL